MSRFTTSTPSGTASAPAYWMCHAVRTVTAARTTHVVAGSAAGITHQHRRRHPRDRRGPLRHAAANAATTWPRPPQPVRRRRRSSVPSAHDRASERRAPVSWTVPDKPSLDGLEDRLERTLERRGRLSLRPAAAPRSEVYSIDTPPPTGQRLSPRRPRLFLYPHRHHRPLQAHARLRRLLPDGLGRQWPPHRTPGGRTTTACAATRRCRTTPTEPTSRRNQDANHQGADLAGRNFIELCQRSQRKRTRKRSKPCSSRLGLSVDWCANSYTTIDDHCQRVSQSAFCATSPTARPTSQRHRVSGMSRLVPSGSRRPNWKTKNGPAPTTRFAVPPHRPGGRRSPHRYDSARIVGGMRRDGR